MRKDNVNYGSNTHCGITSAKCSVCGRMTIISNNKEGDVLCSRKTCKKERG